MTRLSGGIPAAHAALYDSTAEFLKATANPTSLSLHAVAFRKRVLEAAKGTYGDDDEMNAMMDPTLVKDEREKRKLYFRPIKHKFIEQEAKRAFLHAITGDSPESVIAGEQEELVAANRAKKARLKATKEEIEAMRAEALALSRANAEEHARLAEDTAEIAATHKQIGDMELELARLKSQHPPDKRLTTVQADARLAAQQDELEALTAAMAEAEGRAADFRSALSHKKKDAARLEREREREEARAAEVRRQREAGGAGTRTHDIGRWYAASLAAYRALLGIKAARALSESELVLEYDCGDGVPDAKLHLYFDASRRFDDATLQGADVDIAAAVEDARDSNDAAKLVSFVLGQLRPIEV